MNHSEKPICKHCGQTEADYHNSHGLCLYPGTTWEPVKPPRRKFKIGDVVRYKNVTKRIFYVVIEDEGDYLVRGHGPYGFVSTFRGERLILQKCEDATDE